MSAMQQEQPGVPGETGRAPGGVAGPAHGPGDDSVLAGSPVVVRRAAGPAAVIGAGASAIAIAYLWRAVETAALLDWTLCVVMALIAAAYLAALLDSRTPLVVADDLGVRIRLGQQWRGLPWEAVRSVEVFPRRSPVHDGRLVFRPHSLARALDGLEVRGRRHAALNQRLYGAALAVPLGLTTRTSTGGHDAAAVAEGLAALARGRTDVVVPAPEPSAPPESAASESAASESATFEATTHERAGLESAAQATHSGGHAEVGAAVEHGPGAEPTGAATAGADIAAPSDPGGAVVTDEPAAARPRRSLLGGIATIVSRVAKGAAHDVDRRADEGAGSATTAGLATAAGPDVDAETDTDPRTGSETGTDTDPETDPDTGSETDAPARPVSPVLALRAARPALRAEVTRDAPATTLGSAALHELPAERPDAAGGGLPERRELRRPGSVDLVFERVQPSGVRPIATLGDPVEPLVIGDFVTEPAYDPVIGPELAAARTRVGLSVDELAERTRIRPHVIESIEVDDFGPCGGDFYARGHLRTLARVLGQDPTPLIATFDERYATAPINARRVFEAELATGMTGSMRRTVGGPNWGLLVGAVLTLVLVWGLVRLFATEPPELISNPAPVLNGSAGVDNGRREPKPVPVAARPLAVTLVAADGGSRVVVRDADRTVVFAGELVTGERKGLRVVPPVRVQASDAGSVEVRVRGKDRGPVGEPGRPGRRTFGR